jgi:hypothetical protein
MKIPPTMSAPRLKLDDDEGILHSVEGLRKKGLFGNRYGALYVTGTRVAFVKAVMAGGIAKLVGAGGAKPMISFDRRAITKVERSQVKKMTLLTIGDGQRSEVFWLAPEAIDQVVAALGAGASAGA